MTVPQKAQVSGSYKYTANILGSIRAIHRSDVSLCGQVCGILLMEGLSGSMSALHSDQEGVGSMNWCCCGVQEHCSGERTECQCDNLRA